MTEPVKVSRTFWPALVVDLVTAAPPAVIVPVTSAALPSVTVELPVAAPDGSIRIVYVPLTASVCTSMKEPVEVIGAEACVLPSGLSSDIVPAVIAVDVSLNVAFWPAVPLKVTRAFCPGVTVLTVALLFFIAAVASAGTL